MSTSPPDLATLRLSAEVANGRVVGRMTGFEDFRLEVDQTYYLASTDASIAQDIARIGRLLIAQRLQAQDDHDRATGQSVNRFPAGSRFRRELDDYNAAVAEIHDEAESTDGAVRMSAVGMRDLSVEIRPGTVPAMSVATFEATCATVARRLIEQHMREVWRLRIERFSEP